MESCSAPAKTDAPAGLETEVGSGREEPDDLLALLPGHGGSAFGGEGSRALEDGTPHELRRRPLEERSVGNDHVAANHDRRTERALEFGVELFPHACEHLDPPGQGSDLLREESSAQSVSFECEVSVRAVAPPDDAVRVKKLEDLAPRDRKQRADNAVGATFARSREARETALAPAGEEVRLDPVLPLVGGGDPDRAGFPSHLEKGLVADPARARFRREAEGAGDRPGIAPAKEEPKPEPAGVIRDEREIPVSVPAAPAVVHVGDGEAPAVRFRDLCRPEEERRAVGAARNGEEDRRAPRQELRFRRVDDRLSDRVHPLCYDA